MSNMAAGSQGKLTLELSSLGKTERDTVWALPGIRDQDLFVRIQYSPHCLQKGHMGRIQLLNSYKAFHPQNQKFSPNTFHPLNVCAIMVASSWIYKGRSATAGNFMCLEEIPGLDSLLETQQTRDSAKGRTSRCHQSQYCSDDHKPKQNRNW